MSKKRTLILIICSFILLALGIGVSGFLNQHIWFSGQFLARDSVAIDLRSETITQADYRRLQSLLPECEITWNVPFQGRYLSSDSETVTVASLTDADVNALDYLPNLRLLDARGCTDYSALTLFQQHRPGCQVLYTVTLCGLEYPQDAESVSVTAPSAEELLTLLPYLPQVAAVQISGQLPDADDLTRLRNAFPNIAFRWEAEIGGQRVSCVETTLDLSDIPLEYEEAADLLAYLPELKSVNMRGCGLTDEEMVSLVKRYPNCFFLWDITIAGLRFPTDAAEIDLSGQTVDSPSLVEACLPYLPNLTKVIMSGCGLDDETMDALNRRYDDIRFVWSVRIKDVYVRTDATFFYPYKFYKDMKVDNEDLYPLRYCTDMVCIDIGHMGMVTNCEWAAYMPNLKWLIIGETRINDLSPLSGLKNLEYMEMFTIPVTDYSPLLGCTGLRDLCLGNTYGDPAPIAQMTWLENLWWSGVHGTYGLPCSNAKAVLEEALPNTVLKFQLAHPVADGWRQLPNYFAMRDYLGMFYLS